MGRSPQRRLSRRSLLALLAGGAAGLAIEACGGGSSGSPTPSASPTRRPSPTPTIIASLPFTVTPVPTPAPTLEQKAGQMMLVGFDGATAEEATEVTPAIPAGALGAVVLFADGPFNIQSSAQVAALTAGLQALVPAGQPPLIIACDEEGGLVARLNDRFGFAATVSEQEMADFQLTDRYAEQMAETMMSAGVNLNLAPVVDVNVNPDNPIIGALGRSFSGDPNVVAEQATIFIQQMHARGVRCTLKHFPGHGSSTADSHLGFVDVTNTWAEAELIPFKSVIDAGLADAVLTAEIFNANLDPNYPAALSYKTITGLLRQQLGYDGVVMTDSITMHAITDFYTLPQAIELAINAGTDMIAISSGTIGDQSAADVIRAAIVDGVNGGRIRISRIDESYARVMALRAKTFA